LINTIAYNVSSNNEAPPQCSLAQHFPECTARRLTRTDRKPDAAGFGRTQQLKAMNECEPLLHQS